MISRGVVQAIEGKRITIEQSAFANASAVTDDSCFGCMKIECKNRRKLIIAENSLHLPLKLGQTVEVATGSGSLLIQGVFAVLPPALGFIAGFFLVAFIFPNSGESARAAGGALFMFAGALVFYLFRGLFPAKNRSRIVRILDT